MTWALSSGVGVSQRGSHTTAGGHQKLSPCFSVSSLKLVSSFKLGIIYHEQKEG